MGPTGGEGYGAEHFLIPEGSDLLNTMQVCAHTGPTPIAVCGTPWKPCKGHPPVRSAPRPMLEEGPGVPGRQDGASLGSPWCSLYLPGALSWEGA